MPVGNGTKFFLFLFWCQTWPEKISFDFPFNWNTFKSHYWMEFGMELVEQEHWKKDGKKSRITRKTRISWIPFASSINIPIYEKTLWNYHWPKKKKIYIICMNGWMVVLNFIGIVLTILVLSGCLAQFGIYLGPIG